jgi:hypothetical protein
VCRSRFSSGVQFPQPIQGRRQLSDGWAVLFIAPAGGALRGLGEKLEDIERLIADDAESLVRLRELVVAGRGNPTGNNQYGNGDNVTISTDLFDKPEPSKPQAERGKSRPGVDYPGRVDARAPAVTLDAAQQLSCAKLDLAHVTRRSS